MFLMLDIRETGLSAHAFARRLLDERGVSVMAGNSFGPSAAGHLRLSLAVDEARLAEACDRIAAFVESLAGKETN
jgi:arginine:pyruvate transaminase